MNEFPKWSDFIATEIFGWNNTDFGQVFSHRQEKNRPELPLLAVTGKGGVVDRDTLERRDTSNADKSKYLKVCKGDIVYNTMRMWQGVSGLAHKDGLVSPAYTILQPSDLISPDFAKYLVKEERLVQVFHQNSQGLVDDTLNLKFANLSPIKIKLPRLAEQKKIASILTSVDEVIENTQKQIDKLQDLKKATMDELLTKGIGHTEFKDSELGRIPKSWEVVFGNEVFKLGGGSSPSSIQFSDAGDVLFMKVEDFNNIDNQEKIKTTALKFEKNSNPNIKSFPADTIVIAKRGAAIMKNRVKLFAKPTTVDSNLMTIQVTAHNPKFFTYYLTWENLSSLADTTSVPQLNNFHLYEYLFRLPPLKEQNEIVEILSTIDERSIRLKSKLSQTQSLKKSLMQNLLTGKVRVQVN